MSSGRRPRRLPPLHGHALPRVQLRAVSVGRRRTAWKQEVADTRRCKLLNMVRVDIISEP